jgi:hypothetical protein
MSASKQNLASVLLSAPLLTSFLVLMSTFNGEQNALRTSLAAVGFIIFAGLYAALLHAKFKNQKPARHGENGS